MEHTASSSGTLTFEDVYPQYDYIVRKVIRNLIPPSLGNEDDLSQEVWTQWLTGQNGRPYHEIYDPSKGAITTFLWEFTRTRCMQFLSRQTRTPTANAYSIQAQDSEQFQIGIVDPETTQELSFNEYAQIEFDDLLGHATAAVHRQKQRGKRDLRWVWFLIRKGYRQDQIAEEMGLSEGTISICMDLIREIPEVRELRQWAAETGLLEHARAL